MRLFFRFILIALLVIFANACDSDPAEVSDLVLIDARVGSVSISLTGEEGEGVPIDRSISLSFSSPVNTATVSEALSLQGNTSTDFDLGFSDEDQTIVLFPVGALENGTEYILQISSQLSGAQGEVFGGVQLRFRTVLGTLKIVSATVGEKEIPATGRVTEVPLNLSLVLTFNQPVSEASLEESVELLGPELAKLAFSLSEDNRIVNITTSDDLNHLTRYEFAISGQLVGSQGEPFSEFSRTLFTTVDETPKFPVISDEELLTKVQEQTFRYFWDFGHPTSGMARERNTSGDLVTSGGSGFGLMAILVGVERGFITRPQALERLSTIVNFLESADRFHGAWPHWLNGNTGEVIPFSDLDDGGDLVETAFLVQGLLTVRAWLDESTSEEKVLVDKITQLWEEVEWSWYTQGGQEVLYWHWSPNHEWDINLPITGYNESLIVYVLAAGSPTFPVSQEVYENGWARNGEMTNGNSYYGSELPLGTELGGPLFFAHYSFLGLDPRNLSDQYADYWQQNVNHARINQAYCADNPKNYVAYSEACWGLTASDNQDGYSAHSPTNDLGVITPTAALSSFPYTPEASLEALRFFYYTIGDRVWGEYGFYDAINATEGWYADSYLAIDQGPIVVMIENHRSGLLWELGMSVPEVQNGLNALKFSY